MIPAFHFMSRLYDIAFWGFCKIVQLWNNHYIRSVRNSECPSGRPEILYFLPAQNEAQDCAFPVEANDVVLAMSCCVQPSIFGCSNDMINLAAVLLKQTN